MASPKKINPTRSMAEAIAKCGFQIFHSDAGPELRRSTTIVPASISCRDRRFRRLNKYRYSIVIIPPKITKIATLNRASPTNPNDSSALASIPLRINGITRSNERADDRCSEIGRWSLPTTWSLRNRLPTVDPPPMRLFMIAKYGNASAMPRKLPSQVHAENRSKNVNPITIP